MSYFKDCCRLANVNPYDASNAFPGTPKMIGETRRDSDSVVGSIFRAKT